MSTQGVAPLRIGIDATAIGSGRGGDHTYLSGVIAGLSAVADTHPHRYDLYMRSEVADEWTPPAGRFVPQALRVGGSGRLVSSLAAAWVKAAPTQDLRVAYTHAPVPMVDPCALIVTDLSFRHHPEHYPASARHRLNTLVPLQAKRAAGVVTISEFCRADIVSSYDIDPSKVHVVPCTIDDPGRDPGDELDQWAVSAGIAGPFVLYLGNLHPRKNVVRLIEAMSLVPAFRSKEVQLVLAGGDWWNGGGEAAAIDAAPSGSVVRLGSVTEPQREHLLRRAELLAYPSVFEGFGLPPLEALARGTAVVGSNVTAIPEVLGDAAVLVEPTSIESIAEGIDRVLSDRSLRETIVNAGAARLDQYTTMGTGRAAVRALERIAGCADDPTSGRGGS